MCGIYGSTKFYSEEIVRKKLKRIAFRGPDYSQSVYIEDKIILGHNRLSILDLDARSNQPFKYGPLTIVFNGEIFNFREVKRDLEVKGYTFGTTSDTEVICAAYLAYQEGCTRYFNGMFSFVIYDSRNNRLFGSRDRIGKKPFYYTLKDGNFEFASQLSAVTLDNPYPISDISINKYMLRGYIEDPYSIYEGIFKLKAGHSFFYDLDKKVFKDIPYWDIALPPEKVHLNYEEAKTSLKSLVKDAVKLRLISDVPLGTFLSGGIDSALVTAIAAMEAGEKVNAFTVQFHDDGFDESKYAADIAKYIKVNHTVVPCDYKEGIDVINKINYYYDEPFADSSAVPSMLLAKKTREYMTVALSGDGGDEVFMGYSRHRWIRQSASLLFLPFSLRKEIAGRLKKSRSSRYRALAHHLGQKDINELVNDALISPFQSIFETIPEKSTGYEYLLNAHGTGIRQKMADLELKLWLCNDGLVKVDRATMAASMEARCPLLDYRIVEFGRSLPLEYRYKKGMQKRILKDILYDYIPKELVDRPKKGFTMPFREWFRSELKDYVYDLLSEDNLNLIPNLNIEFVKENIEKHMNKEIDFYYIIWRLIILVKWLKGE